VHDVASQPFAPLSLNGKRGYITKLCKKYGAITSWWLTPSTLDPNSREAPVKNDIHPEYATATVRCACGNTFQTRSTQAEIHTDVCAQCHPFFTGKQRFMDTAGRIERFRQKFAKPNAAAGTPAPAAPAER
jgi:large subunit ribosomal protein L31